MKLFTATLLICFIIGKTSAEEPSSEKKQIKGKVLPIFQVISPSKGMRQNIDILYFRLLPFLTILVIATVPEMELATQLKNVAIAAGPLLDHVLRYGPCVTWAKKICVIFG